MVPLSIFLIITLVAKQVLSVIAIPRLEVDLDEHPRKRWAAVAKHWRDYLLAINPQVHENVQRYFGEHPYEWSKIADGAYSKEEEDELIGFHEALGPGFPDLNITHMKLANMISYDGTYVQTPTKSSAALWVMENGTVVHGTNMDNAFRFTSIDNGTGLNRTQDLLHHTYEVLFKKGGKPLYIATTWPGCTGISTAMRFDGWSFEHNARTELNTPKHNLEAAVKGGKIFGLHARRVMESTADFETAAKRLYAEKYMAPAFFILSGKGSYEGAVLTIDHNWNLYTAPIMHLNQSAGNGWHIVQTNDDLGHPGPDPRRVYAQLELAHMKQSEVSVERMFKFLHTPPLFNSWTSFTSVMVPATGYFHTILPDELKTQQIPLEIFTHLGSALANSGASLIEKSVDVKPHVHATPQNRLRGVLSQLDADVTSFMQVSAEKLEM